jgi:hypothetical protein
MTTRYRVECRSHQKSRNESNNVLIVWQMLSRSVDLDGVGNPPTCRTFGTNPGFLPFRLIAGINSCVASAPLPVTQSRD